jgi:predicted lipoprotein with Yx(FWY)xxD motif
VKVAMVNGIGNVLVDSAGRVLYSPDEEATGTVLCTGECVEYWRPLASGASAPTGVAGLATIARPDNGKQVTIGGHPLYTFTTDAPGQAGGNGASDSFDGHNFHWHAVMADGSLAAAPAGSTPTTSGGGYNYGGGSGTGYGG